MALVFSFVQKLGHNNNIISLTFSIFLGHVELFGTFNNVLLLPPFGPGTVLQTLPLVEEIPHNVAAGENG